MFKIAKVTFIAMALVAGAASTPAFAVSDRGVAAGATWARQMLKLMDTDQNGRVSKDEWMRFMEAEFDHLDVDHSGYLTAQEIRGLLSPGKRRPGGR